MGIELKKISKNYNGAIILKDLDLKIDTGEFHVLLGPSGSGKTTILSIIAGLTQQDEGDILIGNRNVSGLPPEKRRIGFVFQDNALFPHLTVFDNVAYGLRVRKVKKNRISFLLSFEAISQNVDIGYLLLPDIVRKIGFGIVFKCLFLA